MVVGASLPPGGESDAGAGPQNSGLFTDSAHHLVGDTMSAAHGDESRSRPGGPLVRNHSFRARPNGDPHPSMDEAHDVGGGPYAVFSFFLLSGYLMGRVLDCSYASDGGTRRFFINRALRYLSPVF